MTEDFASWTKGRHRRATDGEPRIQRLANLAVREADNPEGPTITELRDGLRGVRRKLEATSQEVDEALWQEWDQGKARKAVAGLADLLGYLQGAVPPAPDNE